MKQQTYYKTDIGKVREHNEDAVNIYRNENCVLMVVADGVGGHQAGDIASQLAMGKIDQAFSDQVAFKDEEAARKWMKKILSEINQEILNYIEEQQITRMGTTLVMAAIMESFIAFAHIGDSRAYILAYEQLRQVTKDHTFVRKLVEEGQLSERAAKMHPRRNVIVNALGLGASEDLKFDFLTLENYNVDAVLVCTDGLTAEVEDKKIAEILTGASTTSEKANQLIDLANKNGGSDNISVALCEFGGDPL